MEEDESAGWSVVVYEAGACSDAWVKVGALRGCLLQDQAEDCKEKGKEPAKGRVVQELFRLKSV